MADTVTTQIIQDGPKKSIIKFTNESDGTGESDVKKVDLTALAVKANKALATRCSIKRLTFTTKGMSVKLFWKATTSLLAFVLPADMGGEIYFGDAGIPNNGGAGITGDIHMTTVGHASGTAYSIIVEIEKS